MTKTEAIILVLVVVVVPAVCLFGSWLVHGSIEAERKRRGGAP